MVIFALLFIHRSFSVGGYALKIQSTYAKASVDERESSSFGRARPCQGRGGRFEPGLSLWIPSSRWRDGFFFGKFPKNGQALVVELVDTQDLKSCSPQRECGFNSRLGHGLQPISDDRLFCALSNAKIISCLFHCWEEALRRSEKSAKERSLFYVVLRNCY
jgi:hypothetical protein